MVGWKTLWYRLLFELLFGLKFFLLVNHSMFVLQNTLKRREHLLENKFFECHCKRCSDPTELGTYSGALICPKCKTGLVLCDNPLDAESSWSCNNQQGNCPGYSITARSMKLLLHRYLSSCYEYECITDINITEWCEKKSDHSNFQDIPRGRADRPERRPRHGDVLKQIQERASLHALFVLRHQGLLEPGLRENQRLLDLRVIEQAVGAEAGLVHGNPQSPRHHRTRIYQDKRWVILFPSFVFPIGYYAES